MLLPTGGGKSLCFCLPALVKAGLVLVVSPLIGKAAFSACSATILKAAPLRAISCVLQP